MGSAQESEEKAVALGKELAAGAPMRRGSLTERYVKCSKPGCGCATDSKLRHGPYYSLTRKVGGKTQSRFLSREQAALVQKQIEVGLRFRERIEEYWRSSEAWADSDLLRDADGKHDAAGKKNASRRASTRKSSKKSKG
jgi:hypothetical protein